MTSLRDQYVKHETAALAEIAEQVAIAEAAAIRAVEIADTLVNPTHVYTQINGLKNAAEHARTITEQATRQLPK